jgi:hypothetical protein
MPDIAERLRNALRTSSREELPFLHWLVRDCLPPEAGAALAALGLPIPDGRAIDGRREYVNTERTFVDPAVRGRDALCAELADAFQDPATIAEIERLCGINLAGSSLRLEYAQDTDGFWLEPHTDVGAKLFTMLIYLSTHPDAAAWGTDLYDADRRPAARPAAPYGAAVIFVPGADTWHGFERRPLPAVRRTLIVNYVKPEWRSRQELAFPQTPIGTA